jgi:hypothetical protein
MIGLGARGWTACMRAVGDGRIAPVANGRFDYPTIMQLRERAI